MIFGEYASDIASAQLRVTAVTAGVRAQMEAQEYLGACDCPEYLARAERRLHEEVERCVNYLDSSSEAKITRVVETQLIQKQARARGAPCLTCRGSACRGGHVFA